MKHIKTPHGYIDCEAVADGIPVNPKLPARFDDTPNEDRPDNHQKFWHQPYIQTETVEDLDRMYAERTDDHAEAGRKHWQTGRVKWMEAWPTGTRYDVRCLDGGAWDRSTDWGSFATLDEAVACAKSRTLA